MVYVMYVNVSLYLLYILNANDSLILQNKYVNLCQNQVLEQL